MATTNSQVTRRALAWALGLTVALYAMVWASAGPPAQPETSPPRAVVPAAHTTTAGRI